MAKIYSKTTNLVTQQILQNSKFSKYSKYNNNKTANIAKQQIWKIYVANITQHQKQQILHTQNRNSK